MNICEFECFLFDMDGTIYLGDEVIDGACRVIKQLRKNARVIFLTNNTSVSNEVYFNKLKRLGFEPSMNEIYTAADATVQYLCEKNLKKVFLLGTNALKAHFETYGIESVQANCAKAVVMGFDTELTYQKLKDFCNLVREGAPYIATHPDINCPVKGGFIPDAGSMMALVKASTLRMPDEICGKPNAAMGRQILKMTGIAPQKTVMIGDRLYTDMQFAINNGFYSVLVLSGETDLTMYQNSKMKIDKVINSVNDLIF